jgi:hypothetical protein
MDPVTLAVGAAILVAGVLIGRVARLRRSNRAPEPVCGCGHHYAMHDPATSVCHATFARELFQNGKYVGNRTPCNCRVYTGPQPVQVIWADGVALLPPATEDVQLTAVHPIPASRPERG